jgi:hypothetical protein
LSFKERQEFEGLLEAIEILEEEKSGLERDFQRGPSEGMATKEARYQELLALIEAKSLRWEELAERED